MNDPERFLDGGRSLERALLESASADAGSDAAYRRVQHAIGVATAIGTAGTSAAASGAALGAGKVKAGISTALFGKWLLVGATAGTLAAGTTAYVALSPGGAPERDLPATRQAPAGTTRRAAPAPPPAIASNAAETQLRAVPLAEPPADVSPSRAVTSRTRRDRGPASVDSREATPGTGTAAAVPAPPARSLADEVNLVDDARDALTRNDPKAALAALARHRAEFPTGALRLEAAVLGVRALLGAGRIAEAEREASRVLAAHPTGPYAERVRALLADRPASGNKP